MSKLIIPKWIEEGPKDLEYKTYKFLQRVNELENMIPYSLMSTLWEIDDTLDYLYRYDAVKQTAIVPSIEFMGFPWEDLELVFTTQEELDNLDLTHGVKILNNRNGSLYRMGIREGYILSEINSSPIKNTDDLKSITSNTKINQMIFYTPDGEKDRLIFE